MKKTFKFSPRRDKIEILATLLDTVSDYHLPTQIMYGCSLSWKPTQKLLKHCVEKGWIEELHDPKFKDKRTQIRYTLTDKGKKLYYLLNDIIRQVYD